MTPGETCHRWTATTQRRWNASLLPRVFALASNPRSVRIVRQRLPINFHSTSFNESLIGDCTVAKANSVPSPASDLGSDPTEAPKELCCWWSCKAFEVSLSIASNASNVHRRALIDGCTVVGVYMLPLLLYPSFSALSSVLTYWQLADSSRQYATPSTAKMERACQAKVESNQVKPNALAHTNGDQLLRERKHSCHHRTAANDETTETKPHSCCCSRCSSCAILAETRTALINLELAPRLVMTLN